MLSDFASKLRAQFCISPTLSAATQSRVLNLLENIREGKNGEKLLPSSGIELSELRTPKSHRVCVEHAKKIIAGWSSVSTEFDQTLSTAYCSQLSQTGFPISIIRGYGIVCGGINLVAYPQAEHLETFDSASNKLSRVGGPGYYYRGSIGQMCIDRVDAEWTVRYIQSSVHIKLAVEKGLLPESCRRGYSGWSTGLIRNLFQLAKEDLCQSIRIPITRLTENLGRNRLDKIADEFGYTPASCWPEENKFLYAKVSE